MPAVAEPIARFELPEPHAIENQIDFSFDATFEILKYEFARMPPARAIKPPSREVLHRIHQTRLDVWGDTLGPNLRKGIQIPAAEGADLVTLFIQAWHHACKHTNTCPSVPTITSDVLTSGSITVPKRDKEGRPRTSEKTGKILTETKKLTRYLADIVKTRWIDLGGNHGDTPKGEFPAAFVSLVMDYIARSNGAYCVLSANSFDILASSEYSTTIKSCHGWTVEGAGRSDGAQHSAGNWQYICSPENLILYTYPQADASRTIGSFGSYPNKKYRQFVFVPQVHKREVAWFGRPFPSPIPETQHQPARRIVAAALTGEDPATVSWTYRQFDTVNNQYEQFRARFESGYAYADVHAGILTLGGMKGAKAETLLDDYPGNRRSHLVPIGLCPCCGAARTDGQPRQIACPKCQGAEITLIDGSKRHVTPTDLRRNYFQIRCDKVTTTPVYATHDDIAESRVRSCLNNAAIYDLAEHFVAIFDSQDQHQVTYAHIIIDANLFYACKTCHVNQPNWNYRPLRGECRHCAQERPLPITTDERRECSVDAPTLARMVAEYTILGHDNHANPYAPEDAAILDALGLGAPEDDDEEEEPEDDWDNDEPEEGDDE